jgi:hypothetical protein
VPDGTWKFGTDLNYLQNLVRYWQDGYQWRKHEAFLNSFNQFKASIDGIGVHFIHEIGEGASPAADIIDPRLARIVLRISYCDFFQEIVGPRPERSDQRQPD